jgi:hypothetical protein
VRELWVDVLDPNTETGVLQAEGAQVISDKTLKLGGEAISIDLYGWIVDNLPQGRVILELGSGDGTIFLCKRWKVYSVENNPRWLYHAPSEYIFAELKDGWYDPDALREHLPKSYDLLLIDGPRSPESAPTRHNMLKHLDLFDLSVPIIVDDVNRRAELELLTKLGAITGRDSEIHTHEEKAFGVIK